MARVPQSSGGASRRAYHQAYSKGAQAHASRAAGANRPRTPKSEAPSTPRTKSRSREEYSKRNVSFGRTGNVEDI